MRNLNFACIGVAGYVAPRHLSAIRELKHNLLLSYDKNDSVGLLDRYFPNSLFFSQFAKFKKKFLFEKKIDYTVILTPNYTHFRYIKFALSNGSHVICEKPLVLSLYHLQLIEKLEKRYKKNVFTILQLRTLRAVQKLKKQIKKTNIKYNVKINYITPRGNWYQNSWKGNPKKSGGILFNIGIHLLDLLCYLFGDHTYSELKRHDKLCSKGIVHFPNTKVNFYLSINKQDLIIQKRKEAVRDFIINNRKIDLAKNFDQAHTDCYRAILKSKDFDLTTVKKAIKLAVELNK